MRPKRSTPEMEHRAGELRKEMTLAERRLWAFLCNRQLGGIKFRRQHAIGPFIVDFYAPEFKMVVEVDGGQHVEQAEYDAARTAYLNEHGYRVIRFWNREVMDQLEEVLQTIEEAVNPAGQPGR